MKLRKLHGYYTDSCVLGIGIMVFAIIGIINAATGKAKELP
jgi:hypothetical protein